MNDWLTLLFSTSPAPSNPSIEPIVDTIRLVKEQIDAPVMIICDGVYNELAYESQAQLETLKGASQKLLEERREKYNEYLKRLSVWCDENNAKIMIFPKHTHRANMTREAVKYIETPCVMVLDHDSYLVGDINWDSMRQAMEDPRVNSIRFYLFEKVHPDHLHLFEFPVQDICGTPLLPTIQYGDNPNIHKTEFLKRIIETYIGKNDKMFVEEEMWKVCHNAGWEGQKLDFKLWVYAPENMATRKHKNIREGFPMALPEKQ